MQLRWLILASCSLALIACDPESESVGEGESNGGSSTGGDPSASESATTSASASGSATSTSGNPTSATDPSATTTANPTDTDSGSGSGSGSSTGGGCEGEDMCGPCPAGSEPAGCVDGEWSCTCVPSEDMCALEPFVCDRVGGSINPGDIIDCGVVTLEDSAEDYLAVQQCVLEASGNTEVYKAFVQLQGIDSNVWRAYGSFSGDAYQETIWFYDEGKLAGGEFIWAQTCTPELLEDCEPSPEAGICLACEAPSESVCEDPL